MTRRYLTTEEVAEMLSLDPAGVRRRIRLKELPATNLGTAARPKYRVAEDVLEQYVRARSTTAA